MRGAFVCLLVYFFFVCFVFSFTTAKIENVMKKMLDQSYTIIMLRVKQSQGAKLKKAVFLFY